MLTYLSEMESRSFISCDTTMMSYEVAQKICFHNGENFKIEFETIEEKSEFN